MIYFILWLCSAGVGALIGNAKGNPAAGAFWGFLLGPLGWLVIASVPDDRPRCPECLSTLVEGARKCKHCGSSLEQNDEPQIRPAYHALILNRTWGNAIVVVFAGLFVGWIWSEAARLHAIGENAKQTFERVANNLSEKNAGWSSDPITLAQYNRLSPGMSYTEARGTIGSPGTEVAKSRIEGVPGVLESIETAGYSWTNGDGSNALVIFRNGKLVQKSQSGLR